jgi:TonB family protein
MAFTMPWLSLQNPVMSVTPPAFTHIFTLKPTIVSHENQATITQFSPLMAAYIAGSIILFLLSVVHLIKLLRLFHSARRAKQSGKTIYITQQQGVAISFFGYILMSEDKTGLDSDKIIYHEYIHKKQGHSFDNLLVQIALLLQWFNPFIWLLKKAIQENHEYIADRETSRQGNIDTYQDLMLRQATGIPLGVLVHQFTKVSLKRRFIMLLKHQTPKKQLLKYLAIIPLLALAAWMVSCDHTQNPADKQEAGKTLKDSVYVVVDEMPRFPGNEEARMAYLKDHITYPEKARQDSIQGTVYIRFVVETDGSITRVEVMRGIGGGCDEVATEAVKNMPDWSPGIQDGQPVRTQMNMPFRFTLK